jgi:hypothetical protein
VEEGEELAAGTFPDVLSEFAAIGSSLTSMVEQKRIDLIVVNKLDSLLHLLSEKEAYWQSNRNVSSRSAFTVYHGWRNVRLVVNKMRTRFIEAQGRHENPQVAVESLKVLPSLLDVYTCLLELGEKELPRDEMTATFNRITELRNVAYYSGMLPSISEELQEADKKAVIEEFENFAAVGTEVIEEPREGSP